MLVNISGTQASPVKGVTLSGLGFRDTAYTYMDPHGIPSGWGTCLPSCQLHPPSLLPLLIRHLFVRLPVGGDWALQRTAAVFIEGSEGVTVEDCTFTRLDGNALMLSAYNRGAVIQRNEVRPISDRSTTSLHD